MKQTSAIIAAFGLTIVLAATRTIHAQVDSCSLGKVKERIAPHYPLEIKGRSIEGIVEILATFAPDGHVSSSKALAGPKELRFESQAYINGWRAEPSDTQRQCTIQLEYRYDAVVGTCSPRRDVSVRPERVNDAHVIMHLSCDI